MKHQGVILRRLRAINRLTIHEASKVIGRSVGWLSEIENGRGEARIDPDEFERIIAAYGGGKYRDKFPLWIANESKGIPDEKPLSFDGAILRYLRKKADLSQERAARAISVSAAHLCNLERGKRVLSTEHRNTLLKEYGYSSSSFRNFTTADKRAKNIPVRTKLNILLDRMPEESAQAVFAFALDLLSHPNERSGKE